MTDQIKPGDLVMVVKPTPCCNNLGGIGMISKTSEVGHMLLKCNRCGKETEQNSVGVEGGWFAPVTVLKKLNPPAGEESRETAKELEVV